MSIPDSDEQLLNTLANARILFTPFVFSGNTFPECEFEHPLAVRELIGSYRLNTAFYDANFRRVHAPVKPGRYGAIVEICTDTGLLQKRYITLYKQPHEIDWRKVELPLSVTEMPPGLGLSPVVVQEQMGWMADLFKRALIKHFASDEESALFLAELSETEPGSRRATCARFGFTVPGAWWDNLRARTDNLYRPQYLSWLPDGYNADPAKRWPLIVFLHGAGERGNDVAMVAKNGLAKNVAVHNDLPAIVIAPQCPAQEWWLPSALNRMLDEVMLKYRVDPDRVYLTGLSMGGFGTWAWSMTNPERFAALVPVCGGGDPDGAKRLKGLPIWAFHGGQDEVVPLRGSECMVEAVWATGGNARLTIYPDTGHDSWTAAYSEPELYPWLFAQQRQKEKLETES